MKIGIPKEILQNESRVAMTPAWARTLTELGHEVLVETGAGIGSSFHDADYIQNGAQILSTAEEILQQLIL